MELIVKGREVRTTCLPLMINEMEVSWQGMLKVIVALCCFENKNIII